MVSFWVLITKTETVLPVTYISNEKLVEYVINNSFLLKMVMLIVYCLMSVQLQISCISRREHGCDMYMKLAFYYTDDRAMFLT